MKQSEYSEVLDTEEEQAPGLCNQMQSINSFYQQTMHKSPAGKYFQRDGA